MKILVQEADGALLVKALRQIGHDARLQAESDWRPDVIHLPGKFPQLLAIDYDHWNPATDKNLVRRYNKNTLSLKQFNRIALQKKLALPNNQAEPLILEAAKIDPNDSLFFAGSDILVGLQGTVVLIAQRYGTISVDHQTQLNKMVKLFADQAAWQKLQKELMAKDSSWDAAAKRCLAVYVRELNQKLFKTV